MKLSRNWLHEEFADLSRICDEEYAAGMTAFGRKVTGWERVGDDTIVEFEADPERPDCGCVIGLARESAAAFGMKRKHHEPVVRGCDDGSIFEYLDVDVYADDLCSRYTARMAVNVQVGPSPEWLCRRLRSCGMEPVNNITDIARYVRLEYGQPLRAFDSRCVPFGQLLVREAMPGECLTTPEGSVLELEPGMLVVSDEEYQALGLAGTRNGETAGIREDTTAVIFEAVSFIGDASEENPDPLLTLPGVQRACELVELLGCGDILDGTIDILNYVPQPRELPLEPERINRLLGCELSREEMIKYLNLLEIGVEEDRILIPSFRPDLERTADIAGELARFLQ